MLPKLQLLQLYPHVVLIILSYMYTGNPRVLSTKPGLDNGSELDMNTHFSDLVSPGPAVNTYYQSEFFVHTQHTHLHIQRS